MATLAEIQDQIELGWVYYVQQLESIRLKMVDGCFVCTTNDLTCLSSAILALEYDVETEMNTDLTTSTYNLLLSLLSNFTGSFTADPTVQLSGITITTVAEGITISGVSDADGNYQVTVDVTQYPNVTIYDANGLTSPAQYDTITKIISGLNALEAFTVTFN